jgi:hypothetical protein
MPTKAIKRTGDAAHERVTLADSAEGIARATVARAGRGVVDVSADVGTVVRSADVTGAFTRSLAAAIAAEDQSSVLAHVRAMTGGGAGKPLRPLLPSLRVAVHTAKAACDAWGRPPALHLAVQKAEKMIPAPGSVWIARDGSRWAVCSCASCPSGGAAQPIESLGYRHDVLRVRRNKQGEWVVPGGRVWVLRPEKGAPEVADEVVRARLDGLPDDVIVAEVPYRFAQNRCRTCKNVHNHKPTSTQSAPADAAHLAALALLAEVTQ